MSKEQEEQPIPGVALTGIYFDLPKKTIILAAGPEIVGALTLTDSGIIFDAKHLAVSGIEEHIQEAAAVLDPSPAVPVESSSAAPEKAKAVTLQGKLKSKPREGRPDSRGKPTSWARFAAHEEEHDGAHLYSATFHRHTAAIALELEPGMPLTVQGYPHEVDDPGSKRMDTLSVINLLDYPGKPAK